MESSKASVEAASQNLLLWQRQFGLLHLDDGTAREGSWPTVAGLSEAVSLSKAGDVRIVSGEKRGHGTLPGTPEAEPLKPGSNFCHHRVEETPG